MREEKYVSSKIYRSRRSTFISLYEYSNTKGSEFLIYLIFFLGYLY